jgi:hypothetical protein
MNPRGVGRAGYIGARDRGGVTGRAPAPSCYPRELGPCPYVAASLRRIGSRYPTRSGPR